VFDKHRSFIVALVSLSFSLVACGHGKKAITPGPGAIAAAESPPVGANTVERPAGSEPASKSITGKTVDVKMITRKASYRFDPDTVSLKQGDGIKFTVVSGTHNVTFWPDSIPVGAQAQLNANMPHTTAPLTSPLLTKSNLYTISFANVPKGTYNGYCTPHLLLGMKLTVIVQ